MLLARLVEQLGRAETTDDVLHRLAGTNQADLADAFAATIKDPTQLDAARMWAFRGLQQLLALPQATPPALPRDKEEAALGEVLKFLQARNQPDLFPPGTPDDEIDGFRYVRREAIKALAQCPFPTLSTLPDKPHPALGAAEDRRPRRRRAGAAPGRARRGGHRRRPRPARPRQGLPAGLRRPSARAVGGRIPSDT